MYAVQQLCLEIILGGSQTCRTNQELPIDSCMWFSSCNEKEFEHFLELVKSSDINNHDNDVHMGVLAITV